jgi:hypothetical protein
MKRFHAHFRSNVVGYLALFVALSGTAYSASELGRNAVRSRHIKNGAVKNQDLADNAVTSPKVENGSLLAADFAPGQLAAGQSGSSPAGAVSFFNLAACPAGWTELAAARGRYIVGVPTGGTLAGTAGTALSNEENRPVGQHSHGVTDPGHTHSTNLPLGSDDSTVAGADALDAAATNSGPFTIGVNLRTTGITINNAGSVPGTNAPYIQLLVCQKS